MHLFVLPTWVSPSLVSIAALLAVWRGDWRARALAACQVAWWTLWCSLYLACDHGRCWGAALVPIRTWLWLFEDVVTLAVCLACVWRADRYWVLWASSFTVVYTVTDVAKFLPGVTQWAYASAGVVWFNAVNLTVIVGAWSSARPRAVSTVLSRN